MPVVVAPTTAAPFPATTITSVDNVLKVVTDVNRPGAYLTVDFSAVSLSGAQFVTVTRGTSHVRGLNRTFAPNGITVGYDAELTPSVQSVYAAFAYDWDGNLLATSQPAAVTVPRHPVLTFLTPIRTPVLSRSFVVDQWPTPTYARPVSTASPLGSSSWVSEFDARKAGVGAMSVHTATSLDEAALLATLSDQDGVYWLVPDAGSYASGQRDRFVTVGDVQPAQTLYSQDQWRTWALSSVTQTDRPRTAGWVVSIPGRTFADAPAVPASSLSGRTVDYVP